MVQNQTNLWINVKGLSFIPERVKGLTSFRISDEVFSICRRPSPENSAIFSPFVKENLLLCTLQIPNSFTLTLSCAMANTSSELC